MISLLMDHERLETAVIYTPPWPARAGGQLAGWGWGRMTENASSPTFTPEVLVLIVDGYIGESTRRELTYGRLLAKRVRRWDESCIPAE